MKKVPGEREMLSIFLQKNIDGLEGLLNSLVINMQMLKRYIDSVDKMQIYARVMHENLIIS